jgi:hypothetical protein
MEYVIVKTDDKAAPVNSLAREGWEAISLSTVSGEHWVLMSREARPGQA